MDTSISERSSITTREYPEGPITCCLLCISRELHVLKYRSWTVSLLISWLTVVFSLVLFLVAFATNGWVSIRKLNEVPASEEAVGLWQQCIDSKCSYTSWHLIGAGFKASQALAVLCLLLVITGCVLTFKYCFSMRSESNKVGTATLCLRFITFFSLLMLIPVFAMTWDKDHVRYSQPIYNGQLSYSFVLVTITFVVEATGAFFMYCEMIVILPRSNRPLLKRSSASERYDGVTNEGFVDVTDVGVFPGDVILTPTSTPEGEERLEAVTARHVDGSQTGRDEHASAHVQMELHGAGVAGPLASLGILPPTGDVMTSRFVGITRSEPEYVPRSSYPGDDLVPDADNPYDDPTDEFYHVIRDVRPVQQSISMQNVFNEELLLTRSSVDGRLVTSVSMYNISDGDPEIFYDRETPATGKLDQISTLSWHPELVAEASGTATSRDPDHEINSAEHGDGPLTPKHQDDKLHSQPPTAKRKAPVERRAESRHPDNIPNKHRTKTTKNQSDGLPENKQTKTYKKKSRQRKQDCSSSLAADKPRRNKHDLVTGKDSVSLQTSALLHGQSTTSLHSVLSVGATSIISGCAETEI